ncbi:MAG: flagellar biosynthetic protein FliO [Gammaproteobacteria bacterium]|nr:flagellar biosynthetic protein FliO [Gammaproteobacteria bacterium]
MNSRFFCRSFFSKKTQVLSLTTALCISLALICVFFVSSSFALDSLIAPEIASKSAANNASAQPDVASSILKVAGGLLLVIFAIFGSAWFYRRFGNFSPVANDSLKVIGGLTMGQKEKIVLLQVGDEQVLIGVAPGNIQKLHVLASPIKLNESVVKENIAFADQLGEAIAKWKSK